MFSPAIVYENNDNDVEIDLTAPNGGDPQVITDASPVVSLGSNEDGENGIISGVTNASPPVVTASSHGLSNDAIVVVHNVKGAVLANGTFMVKNVTANTFELYETDGATPAAAPGVYLSGGVWRQAIAGAYEIALAHSSTIDGRYYNYIPATADLRHLRNYTSLLYDVGVYAGKLHIVQTVRGRTRKA